MVSATKDKLKGGSRKCRVCGCDDLHACITGAGPCYWVAKDLCSACVGKEKAPMPAVKSKIVCAVCRRRWDGAGSPGRCPGCGELSFPISIPVKRGRSPGHMRKEATYASHNRN